MDLKKYKELTGITVATSNEAKITATIRRTKTALETLLGFSLKPKHLYTEKGKVQFEGYLPVTEDTVLLPPDEEYGTYKLFPYNEHDRYFHVDPYTNIYNVKLVMPQRNGEFVTITDLDNVVAQYGRDGVGKYIERHHEWFTWQWWSTWQLSYWGKPSAVQLAVDADWVDCYPEDILYLWADMITYYSDKNVSVAGNIKSESVDGHSWSRGNAGGGKDGDMAPQDNPANQLILARYAGPFGSIVRNPA